MKTLAAITQYLFIFLISGLLMSCGGGGGGGTAQVTTSSEYASLQVSLGSTSRGAVGTAQLPIDITRATVTCSGPGMSIMSADLPLDGTPAIISNIPPGVNRVVTINAYNNQLLRMSGAKTIPRLTAGTRTSVSITVADVAVMIISLDPITDIALATDSTSVQITPSTSLQLYSGVTNHVDDSVTWYVNGVAGGTTTTGTISSTGLYHAPATTGSFTVQTVSNEDDTLIDSITVAVVSTPANVPPVANAGTDRTVLAGANVTLNGTGSTDSDGTISSYQWTQTLGTSVTLNNADIAAPFFIAPNVTSADTLTFELTVTDNDGASNNDTMSIIVQPAGTDFHISPKIVHLLGFTQQFTSTTPSNWWEVNGTEGGDNTVGTIDRNGLYSRSNVRTAYDVTIGAVETNNTSNTDTAKMAVVNELSSQKTITYSGLEMEQYNNVNIHRWRYIWGSTFSTLVGQLANPDSFSHYLFFQNLVALSGENTFTIDSPAVFYEMPNSWGQKRITSIPTATFDGSYNYGYLVATADTVPATSGLTQAVTLVRSDRDGAINWANQYEMGNVDTSYGCPDDFYYFNNAISDTYDNSSSDHLIGFSYYIKNCSNQYVTYLNFYVVDTDGNLTHSIRVDPAYSAPNGQGLARLYIASIEPTSDGGFIIAANANTVSGSYTARNVPILLKLRSNYSLEWVHQFNEITGITGMVSARMDDGTDTDHFYLYSGRTVLQINAAGMIQSKWNLTEADANFDIINMYRESVTGDILFIIDWEDPSWPYGEERHLALLKTDSNLTVQWQHDYGILPTTTGSGTSVWGDEDYFYISGGRGNSDTSSALPMIMQIPVDTGIISGVTYNYPVSQPEIAIVEELPAPTMTNITSGSTLSNNDINQVAIHPLTPTPVLTPDTTLQTLSGLSLTMAISKIPYISRTYTDGDTIQFHASMTHLLSDPSVTWSINGVIGGNDNVGTIDSTGFYTPPSSISGSDITVIIRATSIEEPSLYSETSLTIDNYGGGS